MESPIGHDQVQQKRRQMGLPKIRSVAATIFVLDVTLEAQDHVATAFDGRFARNTLTCWVVNNVYVPNAPGLPRTGWVTIMEVDRAATTERDMTRIGARMSLRSSCHPTTSKNGMKTSAKSQTSRRMLLPEEAKEK